MYYVDRQDTAKRLRVAGPFVTQAAADACGQTMGNNDDGANVYLTINEGAPVTPANFSTNVVTSVQRNHKQIPAAVAVPKPAKFF